MTNLLIFLTIICFPSVLFMAVSNFKGGIFWQIVIKGSSIVALCAIVLIWAVLLFGIKIQIP